MAESPAPTATPNEALVVEGNRIRGIGRLLGGIRLERDPLADIRVLQGGHHLSCVITDGKVVDLGDEPVQDRPLAVWV